MIVVSDVFALIRGRKWDEADHPREPSGGPEGGQFAEAADIPARGMGHELERGRNNGYWGGSHNGSSLIASRAALMMGIGNRETNAMAQGSLTGREADTVARRFLTAISEDEIGAEETLYHGFERYGPLPEVGAVIERTLTSTASDLDTAAGYGIHFRQHETPDSPANGLPTAYEFEPGTPMLGYGRNRRGQEQDDWGIWSEAIVAGRFRVTGIRTVRGSNRIRMIDNNEPAPFAWWKPEVTVISLTPVEVFDPESRQWRPVSTRARALAAVKALLRGEKFNPNHEPAGSPEGGQFTTGGGGGGGTSDLTVENVTPQQWADDWRVGFVAMMKSFGATDEFAEKLAGDAAQLPTAAVRVRDGEGNEVYVIDRTGKALDEDMKRAGRYAMEAVQRDPQDHLAHGRDAMHLQISIVDQMSVKDGPGVLGSSRMDGQDIEFKPAALSLTRGNRGEWMPAADEGDILRYLIAHEYGHMRATPKYGRPDSFERLPRFKAASEYARTDPHEAYAEAYAQWVYDPSVIPELADVAKAEGWPGA